MYGGQGGYGAGGAGYPQYGAAGTGGGFGGGFPQTGFNNAPQAGFGAPQPGFNNFGAPQTGFGNLSAPQAGFGAPLQGGFGGGYPQYGAGAGAGAAFLGQGAYGLTPAEVQQVQAAFFQAAGIDGKLDRRELPYVLARLNPQLPNHPQFGYISERIFSELDTNRSGFINVNEFTSAYSRLRAQLR